MSVSTTHRRPRRALIDEHLQGIVRRPPRAEPEAARQESPPRRPARARSSPRPARSGREPEESTAACCSLLPGLGISTRRAGSGRPAPVLQLAGQLAEQPGHPVLLDLGQGDLVDARRAVVAAHRDPRPPQDVLAVDLVIQRMEPPFGIGLGRPVQRMLQGTDRIPTDSRRVDLAVLRHSPRAFHMRTNEAAALPSPQVVLSAAQPVLRPPPTPSRPPTTSRLLTGYRTPLLRAPQAARAGEGLPSSRRHPRTFRAPYAGESLAAASPGSSPLPWPSP